MLRLHFAGQPIKVTSLAGPYRDWTYAEDVAEGIELAWAAGPLEHRLYILAQGEQYSVGDVLEAFRQHVPGLQCQVVPASEANFPVSGEPRGPMPSRQRAAADLGWAPRTSFADGMRDYLHWINTHGPQ
jgi:UDP-glucose 4-epimerase